MIYAVRHVTEVRYDALVNLARFNLRLKPADWPGQQVLDYRLNVSPAPARIVTEAGSFVVNVSRLTLDRPIAELRIESSFTVKVGRELPVSDSPAVAQVRAAALASRGMSGSAPASYLFGSAIARPAVEIAAWSASFLVDALPVVDAAAALMRAVHSEFTYDSKATEADTPPIEAFRARRGVCQDFAHVMIIALRAAGIPAAYVSGYLRTLPPPGKPRLIGADATHAWVNVWCGAALGWIGFDPTNNRLAGDDHIFTAMGRDYADVAPLNGVFLGGAGQKMKVSVDVAPLG